MNIKIGVVGSSGTVGKILVDDIMQNDDLEYVGSINHNAGVYTNNFSSVPDVIIDFSRPQALDYILDYANKNNTAIAFCTTGYSLKDIEKMKYASQNLKILLSSNTSLGINSMRKALNTLSKLLAEFDIEIIESHHNKKIDSPSGTAKTFQSDIEKITQKEIPVHSLRMGGIVGEHSIIFASDSEQIEIKHRAFNKRLFTQGAIKLSQKLLQFPNGFYDTMDIIEN